MQSSTHWQPASTPPPLGPEDVHVWRTPLECRPATVDRLREHLSVDEQERADRYHFEKDRRHFIAGRGILRTLLGRYLGQQPASLRFTYSAAGKPMLDGSTGVEYRFNLTHSNGLALLAVTRRRDVGVDVEHIRPDLEGEQLAERFFSVREVAALRSLPAELRRQAFFHCWTRKEAYIKAVGQGLSLPLDQFDVTLLPHEPAALLATQYRPQEAQRWSLYALAPGDGFVGALAVEGHSWRLWCGHWHPDGQGSV
jgi:4'-phosphopantetheinyl transferase